MKPTNFIPIVALTLLTSSTAHPHPHLHPQPALSSPRTTNTNTTTTTQNLHPVKRDDPPTYGVYTCNKPNFKGTCKFQALNPDEKLCLNALISVVSIRPTRELRCSTYEAANCDTSWQWAWKSGLTYPGVTNAGASRYMDTKLAQGPRSYRCERAANDEFKGDWGEGT